MYLVLKTSQLRKLPCHKKYNFFLQLLTSSYYDNNYEHRINSLFKSTDIDEINQTTDNSIKI